ncbi:MAG TPA: hypothetical protein VGM47_05670 [Gammaproteobacteria bacterium]|jgi:hypothetical protein
MEQRVQGAVTLRMRQDLSQSLFPALAFVVVVVLMALIFLPRLGETATRAAQVQRFWSKAGHDPRTYVYPAAALALVVYAWLRRTYERLIVAPDGLRYVSFLGGPFAALESLHPGWRLSWAEVGKVELQVQSLGIGKRVYWLVVAPDGAKKRIDRPLSWEQVPEIPHSRTERINSRDEEAMRKAVLASPLVRAFRQFGVVVDERPGLVRRATAFKGYDLFQDRGLMVAVVILVAGLVYWLGDTFIVWPYMALDNVPSWPYLPIAILGLWAGYDLGKNAPRMERILISILLAGSLCAASYPLMLRFDAITAPAGDSLHEYTQLSAGLFKPVDPHLPQIYFDTQTYWSVFPNGSTHEFRVLKGALGFYEVDTGRVQDEIHAWWLAHPPK